MLTHGFYLSSLTLLFTEQTVKGLRALDADSKALSFRLGTQDAHYLRGCLLLPNDWPSGSGTEFPSLEKGWGGPPAPREAGTEWGGARKGRSTRASSHRVLHEPLQLELLLLGRILRYDECLRLFLGPRGSHSGC